MQTYKLNQSGIYTAVNNATNEEIELTEAEVREEIYETRLHDMGVVFNDSEDDIREGAWHSSIDDLFDGNTYEGMNYTITK